MSPLLAPAPPTELVALAWLRQRVPGLLPAMVATTLPAVAKWTDGLFLTAKSIPTATDVDLPEARAGYVQLDAWGTNPGGSSTKPPWGRTAALIELVRDATSDAVQRYGTDLEGFAERGFRIPRVQAAYLSVDVERITDDPSGFARFRADLSLDWVSDLGTTSVVQHTTTEGEGRP